MMFAYFWWLTNQIGGEIGYQILHCMCYFIHIWKCEWQKYNFSYVQQTKMWKWQITSLFSLQRKLKFWKGSSCTTYDQSSFLEVRWHHCTCTCLHLQLLANESPNHKITTKTNQEKQFKAYRLKTLFSSRDFIHRLVIITIPL